MADVLRRLTGATRFSPMVEGLPEVDDRFDPVELPAFANSTGLLERDIAPDQPNEFQLRQPQLSPQRNTTPTLGQLTLPQANAGLLGSSLRRPMVEGMPEVEIDDMPQGNVVSKALGTYPAPTSEWRPDPDTLDRNLARGADIAQGVLQIGGGLAQLLTPRTAQEGPIDYSSIFNAPRWSDAPNARIAARAQENAARVQAEREAEDREFRRAMDERRAAIEERRISQAEGATEARNRRTAAEFDVDSQDAEALREAYRASVGGLSQEGARIMATWIPTEYGGDLDLSTMNARGLTSLIDQFNRAVDVQQEANPRAFILGRRGGGVGRAQRGVLPGLGTQTSSRGHDYGGPIGARGVVPPQLSSDDTLQVPFPAPGPQPSAQPRPRPRPRSPAPGPGPQPAPVPSPGSAPGQSPTAPSAQTGRPIIDRDVTPEEWSALPADQRGTVESIRTYREIHPGISWDRAAARVQSMSPTDRSDLAAEASAIEIPDWTRTRDVNLARSELQKLRDTNAQASVVYGLIRTINQESANLSAIDPVRNRAAADSHMQTIFAAARDIQAALREMQHMGVPNGPELAMAEALAPTGDDPISFMRLGESYKGLRRAIANRMVSYMGAYGYSLAPRSGGGRR